MPLSGSTKQVLRLSLGQQAGTEVINVLDAISGPAKGIVSFGNIAPAPAPAVIVEDSQEPPPPPPVVEAIAPPPPPSTAPSADPAADDTPV